MWVECKLTCCHASFIPLCLLSWLPLFLPFSPPHEKCSVLARGTAQRLERGSFGVAAPKSSGRKFLPEICVKNGQSNRHYCHLSSKPPAFGRAQKHRFPKALFSQPETGAQVWRQVFNGWVGCPFLLTNRAMALLV